MFIRKLLKAQSLTHSNARKILVHLFLFLKRLFFLTWTTFKVFIEFVTVLLLSHISVFCPARPGES